MKKLIIALTVSTFALTSALHASDTRTVAAADKGACCDKTKATASCCGEKSAACSKSISKRIAMSPRGAELAMR